MSPFSHGFPPPPPSPSPPLPFPPPVIQRDPRTLDQSPQRGPPGDTLSSNAILLDPSPSSGSPPTPGGPPLLPPYDELLRQFLSQFVPSALELALSPNDWETAIYGARQFLLSTTPPPRRREIDSGVVAFLFCTQHIQYQRSPVTVDLISSIQSLCDVVRNDDFYFDVPEYDLLPIAGPSEPHHFSLGPLLRARLLDSTTHYVEDAFNICEGLGSDSVDAVPPDLSHHTGAVLVCLPVRHFQLSLPDSDDEDSDDEEFPPIPSTPRRVRYASPLSLQSRPRRTLRRSPHELILPWWRHFKRPQFNLSVFLADSTKPPDAPYSRLPWSAPPPLPPTVLTFDDPHRRPLSLSHVVLPTSATPPLAPPPRRHDDWALYFTPPTPPV